MANHTSEQYTEDLFQAIDTIISKRISKLPYDQTIICEITNIINASNGKYLAKTSDANDIEFTVFSEKTDYEVGDKVYVRVPAGDLTQQKVITGSYVAGTNQSEGEIETDNYWWAADSNPTTDTVISGGELLLYNSNNIFPGYQVCRISFIPHIGEIFLNKNYKISELDVSFKLTINYKIPTTLSDTTQSTNLTVTLRALNANLLRNPNKRLTYDINLDSIRETPIQVSRITLSDLKYIGSVGEGSEAALSLTNITCSFGYYLTNNIGTFLKIYTNSNFYKPGDQDVKYLYFHYYDSTDLTNKRLEFIPNENLQVYLNDVYLSNIYPDCDSNNKFYSVKIPVSKNDINTLNNRQESYIVSISYQDEGNITAQDSITLVNQTYYSALSSSIADGQTATKFLTTFALSQEQEEIANYNNGIYYIYGQDGKPTDASASYITRRAYIKFVDYFTTETLDINKLTATVSPDNSMIIQISDRPILDPAIANSAYIEFKIANYYAQNKKNNTISWQYTTTNASGMEVIYSYDQELLFGYSGSQGADYSLILTITKNGEEVPALVLGQAGEYHIEAKIYDYNNNEQPELLTGDLTYSRLGQWNGLTITNDGVINVLADFTPNITSATNCYSATVQASVSSLAIQAFITIPLATSANYSLSGPSTITYDITGKKPFASKLPYKLYENGTLKAGTTATLNIPQATLTEVIKTLYPKMDSSNNLSLSSVYSTEVTDNPPTVIIKLNNDLCWIQPLYIWQNKYPNSMKNEEANQVIIPDSGNISGIDKKIINANIGRILSNGQGFFIGDYGTGTADAQYGLYAFKASTDDLGKVDNTCKLLATGDFSGDLVLTKKGERVNIGDKYTPVYYEDGQPKSTMDWLTRGGNPATLKDIAEAIKAIQDVLSEMQLTSTQAAKINNTKLEITENG